MLGASIGELLAAKRAQDEQRRQAIESKISNLKLTGELAEGIRLARIQQREAIDQAIAREREAERLREAKRREAREARLAKQKRIVLRAERDALIVSILANSTVGVRKDGSRFLRAKPGKAAEIKAAQARVMACNSFVRPERGYPAPPPRRSEDYPAGGAWGHRKGNEVRVLGGEFQRLLAYSQHVYSREGDTDRVKRMCEHLRRLDRKLTILGSETHVRKVAKHNYQAKRDARS